MRLPVNCPITERLELAGPQRIVVDSCNSTFPSCWYVSVDTAVALAPVSNLKETFVSFKVIVVSHCLSLPDSIAPRKVSSISSVTADIC